MSRRVVLVGFEGCQSLDLIGPLEVFAGARALQRQRRATDLGYVPVLAGHPNKVVKTESGFSIVTDIALSEERGRPIDTLLIAGGRGAREAAKDPSVLRAVGRAARRARRVASVCTGSFVLAAAGLLNGRRATTHWAFCDRLAKDHPEVRVERDPIFVRDGNVWTSAGVTAGIDLALAMVEEDLGAEVATTLARWLVVFVRRSGGQAQFSAQLTVQAAQRKPLRELQSWIVDHPDAALDVPELARRVGMSVRHFSRTFRSETGASPAEYVERIRVETARRLLESSESPVDHVAEAAGFGTPEALRRAFGRRVGISPREYRARFSHGHAARKPS